MKSRAHDFRARAEECEQVAALTAQPLSTWIWPKNGVSSRKRPIFLEDRGATCAHCGRKFGLIRRTAYRLSNRSVLLKELRACILRDASRQPATALPAIEA